jgi:hypothetical protein
MATLNRESLEGQASKTSGLAKEILLCVCLSIAFGIFVCSVSNKIVNRQDRRSESVEMERNILRGMPFHHAGRLIYLPPWQNRVLFPLFLELGIRLGGFSPNGWYLAVRFFFAVLMFATFWYLLRTDGRAGPKLTAIGQLLLANILALTFMSPTEMTSDLPEALFAALFISASVRKQRLPLVVLGVIAAANREASAFAGVIWFFLYAFDEHYRINWREGLFSGFVSLSSYGCALGLRYAFGGSQAVGARTQFLTLRNTYYQIAGLVLHPTPFSWAGLFICAALPCALWISSNRRALQSSHKRLLAASLAIALISLFFGNISELRTFISSIVIVVFVAVSAESAATYNPARA